MENPHGTSESDEIDVQPDVRRELLGVPGILVRNLDLVIALAQSGSRVEDLLELVGGRVARIVGHCGAVDRYAVDALDSLSVAFEVYEEDDGGHGCQTSALISIRLQRDTYFPRRAP